MTFDIGDMLMLETEGSGNTLYEIIDVDQPCPVCGGDDYLFVQVVFNMNVGYVEGRPVLPADKLDTGVWSCAKKLENELSTVPRYRKLSQEEADYRRQLIADFGDVSKPYDGK